MEKKEMIYEEIKGIMARRVAILRQIRQYLPECLSEMGYKTLDAFEIMSLSAVQATNKYEWRNDLEKIAATYNKNPEYEVYGSKLDNEIVQVIREFVNQYLY